MGALIAIICLTLAAAIASAAFVYGRQIGRIQRDAEVQSEQVRELREQLSQTEVEYRQLEMQLDQEMKRQTDKVSAGGWDPGQLSDRR